MLNIKLPASIRNQVRALIRNHPGFEAWRVANGGFDSRNMDKEITMRAIEFFGLEEIVRDLIANPVQPGTLGTANLSHPDYDNADPASGFEDETGVILEDVLNQMATDADQLTNSVLDPLRPFLSSTLLDTVTNALAPIVKAAIKPAVTQETVKTVYVDDAGNPIAPVMAEANDASRVGQTTLGKLFGFPRVSAPVALWDASDAPSIDPFYVPEKVSMAKFVTAAERNRYVWLAGPAGTGKTTLPMQYAAHTKRPFVRIAFQRATEPTDLIGMLGLDGKGGMKWRDGVLTKAIRKPGTVILLDEITLCPAGIAAILQTLLDMRFITLPTGEVVHCADGVVFCAADNTRGFGDDSGLYTGTTQSNAAMVDRFSRMVVVNYLPADQESQALANRTGAPRDACDRVVAFINSARKLPGFDARPLSLRRMVAFIEMAKDGFSASESFEDTMLTRLPDAEFEALRQHFKAAFVSAAFEAELSGKAVPAVSDAPQQVAAKSIFDEVQGS